MFRAEGYTDANAIFRSLGRRQLPESIRLDVEASAKVLTLYHRRLDERYASRSYDDEIAIPSVSEAEAEIDIRNASDALKDVHMSAFLRYIREQSLFLIGPNQPPVAVSHDIVSARRYRRRTLGLFAWDYLDPWSFTVRVQLHLNALRAAEDLQRYSVLGFELSGGSRLRMGKSLEDEIDSMRAAASVWRQLAPYEGMCLATDFPIPTSHAVLRSAYGLDPTSDGSSEASSFGLGRPRKQEDAAEAFQSRFPEGKGKFTWKEVLRILEVECGISVSEDTLKAGIRARENTEIGP